MDDRDLISEDVRNRVIEAAEALHKESDFTKLPTVGQVRRRAGCDMNAASEVLRDWKSQLTARPAPVAVVVPENVTQAFMEAVAVSWAVCQDLANANLRAAQADWDREREIATGMRRELSQSYEDISSDLDAANHQIAELLRGQDVAKAHAQSQEERIKSLNDDVAKHTSRADQAEIRLEEMEHRLEDRKAELDNLHDEIKTVRQELTDTRSLHLSEKNQLEKISASEIEKAKSELATYQGRADEAISSRDKQINALQAQLIEVNTKAGNLNEQLVALKAEVKATGEANKEVRKNVAAETLRMTERFKTLQTERDTAVREAANLQGQLQALKTK